MLKKILLVFAIFLSVGLQAQQMPEAWYRSLAAYNSGEYNLALQWIDSCIAKKGNNPLFWARRGEVLFSSGDTENALKALLKAEKLKPNSASYTLSKLYSLKGDTASCFLWLKNYLTTGDKVSEGTIKLEPAFKSVEQTKQWKQIWDKDWYSVSEKLIFDAEYSLSNQNWEEAIDLLNPRLKGNNSRPQLIFLRGKAYSGLGSYNTAIEDFSIAIKRNKKNHTYLAERSKAYLAIEKYGYAIDDASKAIELSGGDPIYFLIRSDAYYKNKQYNQAFDDLNFYLSFYPSNADASFQFAVIAIEAGRYVDALFSLGKLIKYNPSESKYYYYRGLAYLKSGNYSVAEIDFNTTISKGYKLPDSYYQRGITRLNLGKKDEACSDLEIAAKNGNFSAQELFYKNCKKGSSQQKW